MSTDLVPSAPSELRSILPAVPILFAAGGSAATMRFVEFFTANIRNSNTRAAYARAVAQFSTWCQNRNLRLADVNPFIVAAYVEELCVRASRPTVKQSLAAIRMLFDFLVTGQIVPMNPAGSVRGPKHVIKKGKTPVLTADEARHLINSIVTSKISGLRDRALIAVMVYSFARVSAVIGMDVGDYYQQGKRWWFRLHEKGGKRHDVPAHHKAEEFLDAYIRVAGIAAQANGPLFRSLNRRRDLSNRRIHRLEVLAMVKRRAHGAGIGTAIGCHTFRATGITAYLSNGGLIEHAQQIANHESPRTTKLYDRTSDEISLDEIERVLI